MKNRVACGVAFLVAAFSIAAPACSSSDDAYTTIEPSDGSTDVTLRDGDHAGNEFEAGCDECECFDTSRIVTSPTPLPPTANQGKCASDELILQFLSSCVPNHADLDGGDDSGVDAGETCDALVAANSDCALCLRGNSPDAGTPLPPGALLVFDKTGDVTPSVAACIAAISTGTDECKINYANDDLCTRSTCNACNEVDFQACATDQTTDPSSTCLTDYPLDAPCVAAINGVSQTDADTKCGASTTIVTNADFAAVFLAVGKTLCE